jgi:hypothetical protein
MKTRLVPLAAAACVALFGGMSGAMADSAAANCEVRNHGETKKGPSGPCTFSQRQGNISLSLDNGDSYSLTPTGPQGQYRDQKGNKVARTLTSGDTQEFKWDGGRKIILTYASSSSEHASPASGGASSDSPPALADLVGARASSGETELNRRGYTWQRTEKTGADSYSYWRENASGQCVVVRTANGRYASIANAMDISCEKSAASSGGGGGSGEREDAFDTVCGVMVSGQDYQYRCSATDFYSGGQKVRTELRYPDQTIQLTWRPGNRVGLQFEGMKPMEARYSTSEGETNWVFEGKTYFYYSDKGRGRTEWQNLRD